MYPSNSLGLCQLGCADGSTGGTPAVIQGRLSVPAGRNHTAECTLVLSPFLREESKGPPPVRAARLRLRVRLAGEPDAAAWRVLPSLMDLPSLQSP